MAYVHSKKSVADPESQASRALATQSGLPNSFLIDQLNQSNSAAPERDKKGKKDKGRKVAYNLDSEPENLSDAVSLEDSSLSRTTTTSGTSSTVTTSSAPETDPDLAQYGDDGTVAAEFRARISGGGDAVGATSGWSPPAGEWLFDDGVPETRVANMANGLIAKTWIEYQSDAPLGTTPQVISKSIVWTKAEVMKARADAIGDDRRAVAEARVQAINADLIPKPMGEGRYTLRKLGPDGNGSERWSVRPELLLHWDAYKYGAIPQNAWLWNDMRQKEGKSLTEIQEHFGVDPKEHPPIYE